MRTEITKTFPLTRVDVSTCQVSPILGGEGGRRGKERGGGGRREGEGGGEGERGRGGRREGEEGRREGEGRGGGHCQLIVSSHIRLGGGGGGWRGVQRLILL